MKTQRLPLALFLAFFAATGCRTGDLSPRNGSGDDLLSVELPGGVPLELVRCPGGIWFGRFEVTQAQWRALLGGNPSNAKGSDFPVENVSWDECMAFLEKLDALPSAKRTGLAFRLPTKEEWEYALTGGAGAAPTGGGKLAPALSSFLARESGLGGWTSESVGRREPNSFGLYDMCGNVDEWTSTPSGGNRVVVGGDHFGRGMFEFADYSMFSRDHPPSFKDNRIGFRVCARKAGSEESIRRAVSGILDSLVPIPGKDWRMGRFEVTQAQWEVVMGCNPSRFKGADNPVDTVSLSDCRLFLDRLNGLSPAKESGLVFRLPTDEEWQYACRAGADDSLCKGGDGTEIGKGALGRVAWFGENANGRPRPVGSKEPNAFGLYDMFGNVWEWTSSSEDWTVTGGPF